ncbi:MAG: hypothetical protein KF685_12200 [Acidobacteria bacterium]|nr:hypothetical protein [Acidobacteriota bacterium]
MAERTQTSPATFNDPGIGFNGLLPGVAVLAVSAIGLIYSASVSAWPAVVLFGVSGVLSLVCILALRGLSRKLAALREGGADWRPALPDVQRQDLNIEVRNLARLLEVGSEQIGDLQSAYIVAEDLALRQIQQEERIPVLRQVTIEGVPFDAVLYKDDLVICCQVSFLVVPELNDDRIASAIRKVSSVNGAFENSGSSRRIRLMLIVVTQLTPEDESSLRQSLKANRFRDCPVEVDIRLLDFEALQRIYVTD